MQYCFYIDEIEFCATFYRDGEYGIQLKEIEILCPELYPELSLEDFKEYLQEAHKYINRLHWGKTLEQ